MTLAKNFRFVFKESVVSISAATEHDAREKLFNDGHADHHPDHLIGIVEGSHLDHLSDDSVIAAVHLDNHTSRSETDSHFED